MGTNYYLVTPVCALMAAENIYTTDELHQGIRKHIGKSSGGWTFSLRAYPEAGVKSLADWQLLFCMPFAKIWNEYGVERTVEDMLDIITNRTGIPRTESPEGYADWADFHAKNFSMKGPNNLLRPVESERVTHGEGTWDMIIGEFS